MAAWANPKTTETAPRPKRKPKPHLRSLADDLRMIARETAKKGA